MDVTGRRSILSPDKSGRRNAELAQARSSVIDMRQLVDRYRSEVEHLSTQLSEERTRSNQMHARVESERKALRLKEVNLRNGARSLALAKSANERTALYETLREEVVVDSREQEVRYKQLLDAYLSAVEGIEDLKAKMLHQSHPTSQQHSGSNSAARLTQEVHTLCADLEKTLSAPSPTASTREEVTVAGECRCAEMDQMAAAHELQVADLKSKLGEARAKVLALGEQCTEEQGRRVAAEGKASRLMAQLRGLRASAKESTETGQSAVVTRTSTAAEEEDEEHDFAPVSVAAPSAGLGSAPPARSASAAAPSSKAVVGSRAKSKPQPAPKMVLSSEEAAMVTAVLGAAQEVSRLQGVRASELFRKMLVSYQTRVSAAATKHAGATQNAAEAALGSTKARAELLASGERGGSMPLSELKAVLGSLDTILPLENTAAGEHISQLVGRQWPVLLAAVYSPGAPAKPPKDARLSFREFNTALKTYTVFQKKAPIIREKTPKPAVPVDPERAKALMDALFSALGGYVDGLCLRPFDAFTKWTTILENADQETPWLVRFRDVLLQIPEVSALNWSKTDWAEALKLIDTDRDGILSFKEFKAAFNQHRSARTRPKSAVKETAAEREKAAQQRDLLWCVFDKLCQWLDAQPNKRASEVFREWVNTLDTDGSGALEYNEFAQGVRLALPELEALSEQSMHAVFRAVDTGGVKRVRFKDFSEALQRYGRAYMKARKVGVLALQSDDSVLSGGLEGVVGHGSPWKRAEFVKGMAELAAVSKPLAGVDFEALFCGACGGLGRFCEKRPEFEEASVEMVQELLRKHVGVCIKTKKPEPKRPVVLHRELSEELADVVEHALMALSNYISESGSRMQVLWQKWDRDGSGYLEISELVGSAKAWATVTKLSAQLQDAPEHEQEEIGRSLAAAKEEANGLFQLMQIPGLETEDAVNALVSVLDVDSDGRLSYAETSQAVKRGARSAAVLKQRRQACLQNNKLVAELFDAIAKKMGSSSGIGGRKMLRTAFTNLDADRSGFLELPELVSALEQTLEVAPSSEQQAAITELFESLPGRRVSWKDFEGLLVQHASAETLQGAEDEGWRKVARYFDRNREHMDEMFEALDDDQDGRLDLVEVARLIKLTGVDDEMASRLVKRFVVDQEGLVSFSEIVLTADAEAVLFRVFGAIRTLLGRTRLADLYNTWLAKYDADKSGTFSVGELCKAISEAVPEMSLREAEIAHIRRELDSDRNGLAGLSEFTTVMKKYGKSSTAHADEPSEPSIEFAQDLASTASLGLEEDLGPSELEAVPEVAAPRLSTEHLGPLVSDEDMGDLGPVGEDEDLGPPLLEDEPAPTALNEEHRTADPEQPAPEPEPASEPAPAPDSARASAPALASAPTPGE